MNAATEDAPARPSEQDIREYAYHLYLQGGCVPGRDLENWLEAETALGVRPGTAPRPRHSEPQNNLHAHRSRARRKSFTATIPEAKNLAV